MHVVGLGAGLSFSQHAKIIRRWTDWCSSRFAKPQEICTLCFARPMPPPLLANAAPVGLYSELSDEVAVPLLHSAHLHRPPHSASLSAHVPSLQDCFGGCTDPSQGFYGSMDEVRIWKVVRSQDQIIKHMRWSTGLENDKNLVAYWKFNDPDTDNGQFRCRGGGRLSRHQQWVCGSRRFDVALYKGGGASFDEAQLGARGPLASLSAPMRLAVVSQTSPSSIPNRCRRKTWQHPSWCRLVLCCVDPAGAT
jgi:hypothetical protein